MPLINTHVGQQFSVHSGGRHSLRSWERHSTLPTALFQPHLGVGMGGAGGDSVSLTQSPASPGPQGQVALEFVL